MHKHSSNRRAEAISPHLETLILSFLISSFHILLKSRIRVLHHGLVMESRVSLQPYLVLLWGLESKQRCCVIMSAVNITNVTVLDNPAAFLNPFQFEISYECLVPLEDGEFLFDFSYVWFLFFVLDVACLIGSDLKFFSL